jgi:hypothetical protein
VPLTLEKLLTTKPWHGSSVEQLGKKWVVLRPACKHKSCHNGGRAPEPTCWPPANGKRKVEAEKFGGRSTGILTVYEERTVYRITHPCGAVATWWGLP